MALNAFLRIPEIKGSARQRHVQGYIEIHGVVAEVAADIDWKTGFPKTGGLTNLQTKPKPKHKAMILTKQIDLASADLYKAVYNGMKFKKADLAFWRMPPGGGTEEQYYTMQLEQVRIAGVQILMPNNRLTVNELVPELEQVLLTYETIAYLYDAGGKSGGTDPKQSSSSDIMPAEFEPPIEAKIKAVALDYAKDATKYLAGEVYSLFKPDAAKK